LPVTEVAGVYVPTSLRLSPNDTSEVNVPLVVGAPDGEPLPGTSGSPPPHAASSSAARVADPSQDLISFMCAP
jgi:hypothetical protein